MKEHSTQKLFWKKWPFKAIIKVQTERAYRNNNWSYARHNQSERTAEFARLKDWFKSHMPDAGIRCETHLSVFMSTQAELDEVIDAFGLNVLETWTPASASAKELLIEHQYDVIRDRLWYGRYPIRARIAYTNEFRTEQVAAFREAVLSLGAESWHAAGQLKDLIVWGHIQRFAWGQPLHLYMASAEDAAMLRLQCGHCIERFERVRSP